MVILNELWMKLTPKQTKKNNGSINFFNIGFTSKSETINSQLICVKPKNKIAENICTNMMNKKIKNMISTVANYSNGAKSLKTSLYI